MRGIDSTVAVTSRRAYSLRSAGHSVSLAAQITAPTSRSWASISLDRQRRLPAGDGLELVERAAGVAQPSPGELGDRRAARRHQRRQRQRHLVAHAAGRVLVDRGAGAPTDRSSALARVDHRLGPRRQLVGLHAPEQDGHAKRRRLLVGDGAGGVAVDEEPHLLVGQPAAVALGADDVEDVGGHVLAGPRGRRRPAATRPCGSSFTTQLGSAGLEAAAGSDRTATGTAVGIGTPPPRPADRHRRRGAAETSPHSAHSVSPYEAFSTLQPTTTRPSSVSPAAPTRKFE